MRKYMKYLGIAGMILLLFLAGCDASESENTRASLKAGQAETERIEVPEEAEETKITETVEVAEEIEAIDKADTAETTGEEQEENTMNIQVGESDFTVTLEDNSSVDALKEYLANGPVTLSLEDYAGMEKVGDLGTTLPRNDEQINTSAGDIILYQGKSFVIYYDTNSWSLTRLGKINNATADELKEALGSGSVEVTLSL